MSELVRWPGGDPPSEWDGIEDEYLGLLCRDGERRANELIQAKHELSNGDLVLLTKSSRFREKLADWTYTYSYLPHHMEMLEAKMTMAMSGNIEADRDLRAAYLGEGKGVVRETVTRETEVSLE